MLKYTFVLSLLLCIALSIFSQWDNPSHGLQSDQHCALCFTSHNLDHSLPLDLPVAVFVASTDFVIEISELAYQARFVRISGNRDPPIVI